MGLSDSQLAELRTLGDVTYFDESVSRDAAEWLERVKGADIIYSNSHGLVDAWQSVRDAFITLPFVGVGFLDKAILKRNNVTVSRSPGCNQVAVSEWIVAMLLNYSRRLPEFIKATGFHEPTPIYTKSLHGKIVCVLGKGAIGSCVGPMLEGLGMNVRYYTRHDDLASKLRDADFIVDCLNLNDSTANFYNEAFFAKAKDGAVFVTVSSNRTKDLDAILKLLQSGKLGHFITDNASAKLFDVTDPDYRALRNNPNVTITPHVAAYTDNTQETASRMCIENIKAYLAGQPINLV